LISSYKDRIVKTQATDNIERVKEEIK